MRTSPSRRQAQSSPSDRLALYVFLGLLVVSALFVAQTQAQETVPPPPLRSSEPILGREGPYGLDDPARGNSIVRGRAVYEDTGRPVRRARVMLFNTNLAASGPSALLSGLTDGRGEFAVPGVAAGTYLLAVDAPGFISPISFVDLDPAHRGPLPNLPNLDEIRRHFDEVTVDGTNQVEVTVRARRGGAVSGRVTYEDGDPVIGATVSILRKEDGRVAAFLSGLTPSAIFGLKTDDRGAYRFNGLPPGEYLVSVVEAITHTGGSDLERGGGGGGMEMFFESLLTGGGSPLAITYHQAATSLRGATALQVEAGQELTNINITVAERQAHHLSGTVVARRGGQPVPGATVTLRPKEETPAHTLPFFMRAIIGEHGIRTQTSAGGEWLFTEIPDGAYIITVEPPGEADPELRSRGGRPANMNVSTAEVAIEPGGRHTGAPRPRYARRQQEVAVNGSAVEGLVIQLPEGGSISGTVRVEGGRSAPRRGGRPPDSEYDGAEGVAIFAYQTDAAETSWESMDYVSLAQGGTFTLAGLSAGRIAFTVGHAPGQYYLRSITWNGRDLMRQPLEMAESASVTGVQIVLSTNVATLTGRALSAPDRTPLPGARVVLVSADQSRWIFRDAHLIAVAEAGGSFSVSGAPGDYLLIALRPDDRSFALNEESIRARAQTAQRVTLRAGAEQNLDVIVPAANR